MNILFRLLLLCYPAPFRAEFGEEMGEVMAERLRRARTFRERVSVYFDALTDTLSNALRAHLDLLRQDLGYTVRSLSKAPGFALTAIAVTGLGIGANTAVFTVADNVLIRPLPFREPDRLVKLWESPPGYAFMESSPANYLDWKARNTVFEATGAYYTITANMSGEGNPELLVGAVMTADTFPLLGVPPALGRWYEDTRGDADDRTVVLSYDLWQSHFGGDPAVLGKSMTFDGETVEVIGVMPRGFHYPQRDTAFWRPLNFRTGALADYLEDRSNNMLDVIARLRDGVSVEQAREQMTGIATQLAHEYPEALAETGANVVRIRDEVPGRTRLLLGALLGAALAVLLIACGNLANLLVARAASRSREIAVRQALGAGRDRLLRQLLTESAVLASLGSVFGIVLAIPAIPFLSRLAPTALPVADPTLDLRVLAFTAMLMVLTSVALGIYPALRVSGTPSAMSLREGTRGSVGGRRERFRFALVSLQVTVSVSLLVCAGLLLEALWQIRSGDPGFRSEGVLTLRTALPLPKYPTAVQRQQFYTKVLEEVRTLPGVEHAAYTSALPMVLRGGIWPVSIGGVTMQRRGDQTASLRFVTPGYFSTLGIPLAAGRVFQDADGPGSALAAVVSRSFAERYWPGQDPLDRTFHFAFAERRIVGVVGDVRVRGMEQPSEPQVYLPAWQMPAEGLPGYAPKDLAVKMRGNPETLLPGLRGIIRQVDPEQAISLVRTLSEIVDSDTAPRLTQLRVLGIFAGLALVLAAVGIHGLLSFMIAQRSQEIGVRMALGAARHHILLLVFRESFAMVATGIVLGSLFGYLAGRSMEALLAGLHSAQPLPFVIASILALAVTALGSLRPTIQALRVDPITVMRSE